MKWFPHVTVAAVVTDALGRHLLVEEAPQGIRVVNQPAGHWEAGETLLQAARREVLEETCRDFQATALIGIYQWTSETGKTYLRFCFAGEVTDPLPQQVRDPDILGDLWVDPQTLLSGALQTRSPMVLRCIEDHQAGHLYPLSILQTLDFNV